MKNRKMFRRFFYLIIAFYIVAIGSTYYYLKHYPKLTSIDVSELEKLTTLISPDREKVLTIYLGGGMMLYSDFTYIGEVQELNRSYNIFLMPGKDFNVQWVDEDHISIDGKLINIESTYDFRQDKDK
ncbi:DUF5412 family protein [Paenisporosarcina macmurdoensis]|uniref:DUF5412 family protein n=1 Tax=Paenisporosarcina macmurdoensis TaxID=212659 RepID=A0ABW1L8B8_9BACL